MNQENPLGYLLIASSLSLALLGGCGSYSHEDENIIGKDTLISFKPMFDISSKQLQPKVSAIAPGHPAFGIKGYRVVYKTHDDLGNEVNASALITVPVPSSLILEGLKKQGKNFTISMVEDNHGTIFPDSQAPTSSVIATHKPSSIAVLFSGVGGFMTIQPDYIGYGQSANHIHPYLLKKSSANTVIDLLKSAIKFGNDNSLPLNGQIFLTGYSEGGYVTLAAQEEIEKNHPELHLKGVVGMSGPYNLALVGMGVLSQPQIARPDFIGAIINSYANVYGYKLDDIINAQYASKLPTLYDKKKTGEEIMAELTHETKDFITPTYRADFLQNDKNPLKLAFVKNSVDNFKPTTPTRLFYCGGDKTVPAAISLKASKSMGVDAFDINSSLSHAECAVPAYGATLKYFDELRSK